VNKKISLLYKAVRNPFKVIRYIFYIFSLIKNNVEITLSTKVKASGGGERLVIKNLQSSRNSNNFVTLTHIQRYDWLIPHVKDLRCLDAGCGSGYGTYFLSENTTKMIIGIDISADGIKYANRHYKGGNIDFMQMNVCNLGFVDNFFDAVICFDVIEHLNEEDQIRLISEIARVLNESGLLYIGCPNGKLSQGGNPFHLKELTKKEFELLLQEFFKNIKVLGQDIIVNGIRQKENWNKYRLNLSYLNLTIVEEDSDLCHGLLAICKK